MLYLKGRYVDMTKEKVNPLEVEALGEKWDHIDEQEVKNTRKEIKLLKKKIRYLKDRIILYESELATLEGVYEKKTGLKSDDDGVDRLIEMKRTVGDDLTRRF